MIISWITVAWSVISEEMIQCMIFFVPVLCDRFLCSLFFSKMQSKNWNAYRQGYIIKRIKNVLSALLSFNIQSSFNVKNPHVRLVEIGHMTTLCVSVLQSLSAVIKKYDALQLLQLSIHSKTVQIFIQVLAMNSVTLI